MDESSVNGSLNGSSSGEVQANGTCTYLSNGNSSVKESVGNQKLNHVDQELVRLIGQHLKKIGLERTVEVLMDEASVELDHSSAESLCKNILSGEWQLADNDLRALKSHIGDNSLITEMRFLVYEQSYLELLESGNPMEALKCLRSCLTPLAQKVERVHHLSSLMFISDPVDLRKASDWPGVGLESRQKLMEKLQSYLPPSIMLPHNRLEKLILQAIQYQRSLCAYHNSRDDATSYATIDTLLVDHRCSRQDIPYRTSQLITDHCDEVWVAKFSPDGNKLATGSKDSVVVIWKVHPDTYSVSKTHIIDGNNYGVVCVVWSPDSTKILLCLHEEASELLVYDADKGTQIGKVFHSSEDSLTSASWLPDSRRFVCGGLRGQFYLCEIDGRILETFDGVRIQCLATLPKGEVILAADTHSRIRGYHIDSSGDFNLVQEDHNIMSFTVDSTGKLALLNVATQGLHLWDLETKSLIRKYRGPTQVHYTIHSSFGGENECFMASGSEDCKVYIWHRNTETPIGTLTGHSKTVNCVSWNPVYSDMMVTSSDDSTVRIWGPAERTKKRKPRSKGRRSREVTTE